MDPETLAMLSALGLMVVALIYRALGGPTGRRRPTAPLDGGPEQVTGSSTPVPKDDLPAPRGQMR